MKQHLDLLARKAKDKVTNKEGVVVSVSFDISGCVQAYLLPPVDKDGKQPDGMWFDTKRLDVLAGVPVTEQPTFEVIPGGQSLPSPVSSMRPPR